MWLLLFSCRDSKFYFQSFVLNIPLFDLTVLSFCLQNKQYYYSVNLWNVAICFIIMLSDKVRASDRVSIAFATTTVSHRAPSILRHALQTIYGKSIPQPGKADYYDSTSLSFSRKPGLDRAYSVSQESDVAILLRVDKGIAFYRYENLAKIKNRRSSPRSPLLILFTPVAEDARVEGKGWKDAGEYVRERVVVKDARKESEKVRYDMRTECFTIPFFRSPSLLPPALIPLFSLALCSTSVIPSSFLKSFFLPFVLLNSARTYILYGLYLHTAKSFAWFHGGSSIPELKFKGGAVRAVCSTRHESIIFYLSCAAQARSILFVLLLESPSEPSAGYLPDFPPFAFALCSSFVLSSVWFSFT